MTTALPSRHRSPGRCLLACRLGLLAGSLIGGAPATASEIPASNVDATALQQTSASCTLPEVSDLPGLEWARQSSFRSVCLTAHWLDGLFGTEPYDPVAGVITGFLALDLEKRQGENAEVLPRLRTTFALPNVSRKLDLFFDRDKESKTISGESAALHPEGLTKDEASTNQIGIAYKLYRDLNAALDTRVGLRFRDGRPDLFVRASFRTPFADSGTDRWNIDQSLFWTNQDGAGETTLLDYERHLGGPFLLRWRNSASFSQTTDGIRWTSGLAVFHALTDDRAMQWAWGANGESGLAEKLTSHGPRITIRQRLRQRWLVLEAYVGIDHLKSADLPTRTPQNYLGAKIEAWFNPP